MSGIIKSSSVKKATYKIKQQQNKPKAGPRKASKQDTDWIECEDTITSAEHDHNATQRDDLQWLFSKLNMGKEQQDIGYHPDKTSMGETPAVASYGAVDPIVYLTGVDQALKVLDICDFVNTGQPVSLDISALSGPDEVLQEYYKVKSGSRRPKLEDVSIAQWSLANARIFDKLFWQGNFSQTNARRYLAYTAKISEMFVKFEKFSVLEYDRRYRHYQAASSPPLSWGVDIPHLASLVLVPLRVSSGAKQQKYGTSSSQQYGSSSIHQYGSSSSQQHQSRPRCKLYSTMRGCKFGVRCNYDHSCMICGGPHPQFAHDHNHAMQQFSSTPTERPQF